MAHSTGGRTRWSRSGQVVVAHDVAIPAVVATRREPHRHAGTWRMASTSLASCSREVTRWSPRYLLWLVVTAITFWSGATVVGCVLGDALAGAASVFTLAGFCIPSLLFNTTPLGRERVSLSPAPRLRCTTRGPAGQPLVCRRVRGHRPPVRQATSPLAPRRHRPCRSPKRLAHELATAAASRRVRRADRSLRGRAE